jgi:hypothetical protein
MFRRGILLLVLFAPALTGHQAAKEAKNTLRQAIAAQGLTPDENIVKNLDKPITSGATLDDTGQFVIAYYVDDGSGVLKPPLYIERYDRKLQKWESVALEEAHSKSQDVDLDCLGSVLSIRALGDRLLLDTHLSPSAGCALILSRKMKLEAGLYGWYLGQIGGDEIIYHRSEVHFASAHPAEIALFDLSTKRDLTLFPRKPYQAIRRALIEQLKEFFRTHEDWCNKFDDPCDPDWFDSSLTGEVATEVRENALAFVISYEQRVFPGKIQKPIGPKNVLYVYRHANDEAKMEYLEMLLTEAKERFGDVPLQKFLEQETLQKIFSEPPVRNPKP